jgi:hypothetical protein
MLSGLGSVLTGAVQLAVAVGFLYAVYFYIRVQIRRGAMRFPNVFQPGWRQLHNQYGSPENVHTTEFISGIIGARNYDLKLKFNAKDVLIRNTMSPAVVVQIPYADIHVVETPASWQLTSFSAKEYTPGKFQAGGVVIELPAYWADQLLKHMATAGCTI